MTVIRVAALWTYPAKDRPGQSHHVIEVETEGLVGDRRKKAPVSIVGRDAPTSRANLVLDCPNEVVESWDGAVLVLGDVVLAVTRAQTSCPGVYASVGQVGALQTGQQVRVEQV